MTNRILTIPKHKLKFDNGITLDTDVWIKYSNHMLYRDIKENSRLFYRIIPYLIITNNDRYLVLKNNGHYCFNINSLCYIKENMEFDPIKSAVKASVQTNNIKAKSLKCCGFIKSIYEYPNDIAVLYIATTDDKIKNNNMEWMNLDDLIDKCRKFDSFGIEYINYLVIQKIKRR